MTPRERLLLAAHGGTPDKVPVAPYMGNHGARVAGVPIGAYCRSGQLMADAPFRAWQLYGQDAVVAQSDDYYIAEGFGVEVAEKRQALVLLHICGNMTPVLELMADTGAHILELDSKVDLAAAKARVGRRVYLMGNLSPAEVLWQGTPTLVETAAVQAIGAAGDGGGFILGSGCEVPACAPRENIHAMIRVARRTRSAELRRGD